MQRRYAHPRLKQPSPSRSRRPRQTASLSQHLPVRPSLNRSQAPVSPPKRSKSLGVHIKQQPLQRPLKQMQVRPLPLPIRSPIGCATSGVQKPSLHRNPGGRMLRRHRLRRSLRHQQHHRPQELPRPRCAVQELKQHTGPSSEPNRSQPGPTRGMYPGKRLRRRRDHWSRPVLTPPRTWMHWTG